VYLDVWNQENTRGYGRIAFKYFVIMPYSPANDYYSNQGNERSKALSDVWNGLRLAPLWLALAYEDIRTRYMRSFAGIGWVFMSFAFFVYVKIIIFAPLSGKDLVSFAPYVTIGYFVWMFISHSVTEACSTFISSKGWIKGSLVPYSTFVFRTVTRNLFVTLINALVVVIILAYTRTTPNMVAFFAVPMFALMIINAISVSFIFGALAARYRDFMHMISTLMRVMLFLTPIFWLPEQMGELWTRVLIYNPFAHFLISIRDPILYGTIPYLSVYVVLGCTVLTIVGAVVVFTYSRRRIPFWI